MLNLLISNRMKSYKIHVNIIHGAYLKELIMN